MAKSATFGVKWASDDSFCPSTVDIPRPYHIVIMFSNLYLLLFIVSSYSFV